MRLFRSLRTVEPDAAGVLDLPAFTCSGCEERWTYRGSAPPALCAACERTAAPPPPDRLAAAGVPARFRRGWSLAEWEGRFGRFPGLLDGWAGDPPMLYLWGPTGTGKTGAAALAVEAWALRGAAVLWQWAVAYLDLLRAGYAAERSRDPDLARRIVQAQERTEALEAAPLLVLDGLLELHQASPWALEKLGSVLVARYNDRLPTLVTGNHSPARLGELAPPLASRLVHASPIRLSGPDRRLEEEDG